MSYVVIARKYRPLFFRDVIGQEHITKTLSNAIKSNRLCQAFLFTGTRGVGKTTTARILAKAVNCEKGFNPEPCNECNTCKSITDGQYVDVLEIDGASNNSVEDVRNLRSTIQFKPMLGRFKVYIIDEVHMLSQGAFNALLKTLEEPPAHSIFIFATTDLHKVPETIISRCQIYQFRKISLNEIIGELKNILKKEKINFEDDAVAEIAKLGEGSMRDSESLLDHALSYSGDSLTLKDVRETLGVTPRQTLLELSEFLFSADYKKTFDIIETIINAGYDINQFSKDYIQFLRDMLYLKKIKNQDKVKDKEILVISQKISSNKILLIIEELLGFMRDLKFTAFTNMLFEITFFKILRLIDEPDFEELKTNIKKIELMIASGKFNVSENNFSGETNLKKKPQSNTSDNSGSNESNSNESNSNESNSNESDSGENSKKPEKIKKNIDTFNDLNNIKLLFNEFGENLEPPLGEYLKKSNIISATDSEISVEVKGLYFERLNNEEIINKLNNFLREFNINQKVVFEKENSGKTTKKKLDSKKEAALENPSIKQALNIFGGTLIDVKKV